MHMLSSKLIDKSSEGGRTETTGVLLLPRRSGGTVGGVCLAAGRPSGTTGGPALPIQRCSFVSKGTASIKYGI